MGASSSKIEEDKALQLCRERKKFVRQALDGRCSLASAHLTYIQSLERTGIALRKFVQPEAPVASSFYTSTSATPEPFALTGKSFSQFSSSPPSVSQRVDAGEHHSPSPSPPSSSRFHVNHMRFRGSFAKKVVEKPPIAVTGTITSLGTPQNFTPSHERAGTTPSDTFEHLTPSPSPSGSSRLHVNHMRFGGSFAKKVEEKPSVAVTETMTSLSTPQNVTPSSHERAETTPPDTSPLRDETSLVTHDDSPWDYFGLFHPIDNDYQSSSHQGRETYDSFENSDDAKKLREDEGTPELEDEEDKVSSDGGEGSQESDDEFDDPSSETLVRSFKNLNREASHIPPSASPTMQTAGSATPEHEILNGEKLNSPKLSPLRGKSSETATMNDAKMTPLKEDGIEHTIAPKDFLLSVAEVENLFNKASKSGREVPNKLEVNKLHFRPIIPGQGSGSTSSMLFKACFSCGEDPSQVLEEPAQAAPKYLTWHRTISSRTSSSRNLLAPNPTNDSEEVAANDFESVCMNSGSHASTLDRLHAWERKLYDEVKASQIVRKQYDMKCKILREQESRDESSQKVDKTRAAVKDLHTRIRVAIHRIHSISKRIEELRDKELEPQLEELIEGLCRMWEVMFDCHRRQLHIITIAYCNSHAKIPVHSETHRHLTAVLEGELNNLASSFTKWISSQKSYVQAINNWLHKCVALPKNSTKRKRHRPAPDLKRWGPPIYTACGMWLEMLESLPAKEVADTAKGLATETSRFLPRQEKSQGKKAAEHNGAFNEDEGFEDWNMGYVQFRSSLTIFLDQLRSFAEHSMKMYSDLQKSIQEAKRNYEHLMSQP